MSLNRRVPNNCAKQFRNISFSFIYKKVGGRGEGGKKPNFRQLKKCLKIAVQLYFANIQ
jgi:hypothetical protein